ncbi:MAG: hypothetical protein IT270_14645 [Saprospiraceae bacterium]|nr:hypothetical protein [Saprospiraceae bacterium]
MQAPILEALASRINRNLKQLAGAIAFSALVVSGTMLLFTTMGGWHHLLGVTMLSIGVFGILLVRIGAWFRERGRR